MKQTTTSPTALRVADLAQNHPTPFAFRPETEELKAIAAQLDLLGLRKLSFQGEITATGAADWQLQARLGATVVQPCGVTLAPVTTRIDADVTRLFLSNFSDPDEPEAEMPADDTSEQLGTHIDPRAIMLEALALELPLYPRAPDAGTGDLLYAGPGVEPMRDEDARPFAGLADLRDQLARDTSSDDTDDR
ncbi:YceD family protein [uncultured Roseobacter sp.]|uniref:YceD family protein n=1 Tax=uncultured Roseobacter sp. TaxID=114847 RepID=UPI002636B1C3|nr:YceD family protein [uncultured Roseobacter sp.]